jgi:hypothetical protein
VLLVIISWPLDYTTPDAIRVCILEQTKTYVRPSPSL